MVRKKFHIPRISGLLSLVTFCLIPDLSGYLSAQGQYNYYYRIYFRDKGSNTISEFRPEDLISERALKRREKIGIESLDYIDLPVAGKYLNEITSFGFKLHCTSKWMNTALFKTDYPADINQLLSLPFVKEVRVVKNTTSEKNKNDKLSFQVFTSDQPSFDNPLTQVNGLSLHESGLTGKGIMIAVLDGGFLNADKISSLIDLRRRKGIIATFDFIEKREFVYDYHNHGTAVLSVLAGMTPGTIHGSGPEADYILLRTEDVNSEFPFEEDLWTAGAEFADSAGADIISSSLGYFNFDDPSMNYKYSDMDGNATFVTRAADIAASRGILVVNSAGNERDNSWKYIIAPADGDSVLAIGAVDEDRVVSAFSSAGPAFDKRIKPDVAAQGVSVPIQVNKETVERGNGTSFSCPVISGICACLMQAVPKATASNIRDAVRMSADRFIQPDSLYGYGIPDIVKTLQILQAKFIPQTDNLSSVSPNPFQNEITVNFSQEPGWLRVEIINISGTLIYTKEYGNFISRTLILDEVKGIKPGIYFIRLSSRHGKQTHKVIKVTNRI